MGAGEEDAMRADAGGKAGADYVEDGGADRGRGARARAPHEARPGASAAAREQRVPGVWRDEEGL